jgi:1-acyl-sn-glycerol-3-phosphate acyltransferase
MMTTQSYSAALSDEHRRARSRITPSTSTLYERLTGFAASKAALVALFVWAFCEAILWPIIPDFLVAPLAFLAPTRFLFLAGAAISGSTLGGVVAHSLDITGAGAGILTVAPLVTDRMVEAAAGWLDSSGAAGLVHQPLSGVPYKVFALQSAKVELGGFIWYTVLMRGARLAAIAAVFAAGGVALRDRVKKAFPVLLVAYVAIFLLGFARTYQVWTG